MATLIWLLGFVFAIVFWVLTSPKRSDADHAFGYCAAALALMCALFSVLMVGT